MKWFRVGIHKEIVNVHRAEIDIEAETLDEAREKAGAIIKKCETEEKLAYQSGEDTVQDDGIWVEDLEEIQEADVLEPWKN